MTVPRCTRAICVSTTFALMTSACGGRAVVAAKPPSSSTTRTDVPAGQPSASTISAAGRFLDRYVMPDGRVIRRDQGGDIVSEGQALGMVLAEIAGRPGTALTIWNWTKSHLQRHDGLLAFHANGGGAVIDEQAASDADMLAAYALLRYMGTDAGTLHADGSRLASAVMEVETTTLPDGAPLVVAGPWAKASPTTVNPSYWMPVIFRMLANTTKDRRWSQTEAASVSLIDHVTEGGRTLPPDWAHLDGSRLVPIATPSGSTGVQYGLDAARLPVWFAVDCSEAARHLAAGWWLNVLSVDDRAAAIAMSLRGEITNPATNPLPLVAGAAAARAADDRTRGAQLSARAASQSAQVPTYYGDAWLALGGALLDGSLTTC